MAEYKKLSYSALKPECAPALIDRDSRVVHAEEYRERCVGSVR
jgi:hypothetical protein